MKEKNPYLTQNDLKTHGLTGYMRLSLRTQWKSQSSLVSCGSLNNTCLASYVENQRLVHLGSVESMELE